MAFDLLLKAGSTSQRIEVLIRDATTGQGKTGIAAGSVTYSYLKRGLSGPASGTCTAATVGSYTSAGWAEIDATNMPGAYQFGVPNLALSSTDAVTIRFKISGCIDKEVKIVLTAVDLQDAAAAGISRLDAAMSSRMATFTPMTAGDVWANATRSLTDKSGFSVTGTVSANVVQWNGTAVNQFIAIDGKAYPSISVEYFDNQPVGLSGGYPLVNVNDKGGFYLAATQAFDNTAQGTAMPATISGTVSANVVSWSGTAVSLLSDGTSNYPKVGVRVLDTTYATNQVGSAVWGMYLSNINTANTIGMLLKTDIDATISSRATATGVWDLATSGHTSTGTFGEALSVAFFNATVFNSLVESSGGNRFKAKALETAPTGGGSSLTAADVWAYASRTLTYDQTFLDSVAITTWNFLKNDYEWQAGSFAEGVKNGIDFGYPLTSGAQATLVDAIWDEATSGHVTTGSYGKLITDNLDAKVSSVGGSGLTAAAIWSYGTRSLTDKAGFSLAAAQSFDNTGQTANLPANLKAWNGYTVNQLSLGGGAAAPTVNVGYWATYTVQADASGFPLMYVHGSDGQGDQSLRNTVWQAPTATYGTAAGSFGRLLADDIDAKISSRLASGGTVNANVTAWNGYAVQSDAVSNYPLVFVSGMTFGGTNTVAQAVWQYPVATYGTTAGSFGKLMADNLDAKVSTRSSLSGTDVQVNVWGASVGAYNSSAGTFGKYVYDLVAAIPANVWDLSTVGHTTAGTFGAANSTAGGGALTATDVWAYATRTLSAAQSFNNTGQTSPVPANVTQFNGNGAATSGGYPFVMLATGAVADVWGYPTANLVNGVGSMLKTNLDTTISSRLAGASYVVPDNASIAGIKAQTDKVFFVDHGDGSFDVRTTSTGTVTVDNAAIAAAVWSAGTRSLTHKAGFSLADGSIGNATFSAGAIDSTVAPNLDAQVSSRMATFAYVAPDNAGIAAIKAQTDQIVFTAHGDGTFDVRANAVNNVAVDNAAIAMAIWSAGTRSLTDKAGFILANGSISTSTFAAGAIDATVAPNLDAQVSSRMASFVYTAPDNAGIAAIKAQTDQLVFISGDLRATLDGEVVSAGVDNASIAASVWANATRTITGGTVDTVTNVTNAVTTADAASIAAIKATSDKIAFVAHGDGTWDVRVPVPVALTAADVWGYGTRSLTDRVNFTLADGSVKAATFAAGAINATVAPNLDAAVSSRMASFVYVAPDNAGIAAVRAQTDKLHFSSHGDGTFDVQGNATATLDTDAVATAVWANAARTITGGAIDTNHDKAGYGLAAGEYLVIGNAVWSAADRVITGGSIDTNKDKGGYALAADQYTNIASAMWTDGERGQIRHALGLSGARKATDGDGVTDSIYRITGKLQFNSQSDVIASLDGEAVHLNPMQNFNNIGQRDEVPAQDSTLRLRLTDARAAKIDNLDAQISTRSSHGPADVWSFNHRTLTSFGTLVSDIAAAVWTFGSRTLTGFGSLVGDIWSWVSRTITAGTVDLSAQAKADVKAAADAALVDFDPLTYNDAAFDRDQIIDQVEAVLAAVRVKPDAAAIAAAVDALLTTNHGAGDWRDTSHGVGPVAYTVRVTDGTNPIAMASVRLSVGPVGISLTTGADGTAAFDMQPGTYTLRIAKLGYSGHTATVTINANPADQSYDAQVNPLAAIAAPPDPDKCTAYLTTYDGVGNKQSGVSIELRLVSPPPGNAQAFSAKPWTVLSDAEGLVQEALLKNAAYQARRGAGEWHLVKTTNADTIPLPTVLSHPNR